MGQRRERSSSNSSNERGKHRGDNRRRSRSDSKNNKRKSNRVLSESRSRSSSKNRNNNSNNGKSNNKSYNNTKRYRSRSRSDSRDRSRNHRTNDGPQSYSRSSNHRRLTHEEMKAKRIQDRGALRIRKTVWDYSTDEEDYVKDITVFWSQQEKELSLINEEQKQKEERRRLRKLRKIQRKANNEGSENEEGDFEDSDTISNDSQDSSNEGGNDKNSNSEQDSSDLDSDNNAKTRKQQQQKKGKTGAGSKKKSKNKKKNASDDSSDDDENGRTVDPAGNESEDSFAELCREKINGPDPKKVKQQQKAALARKKALAALAASMAADNDNANEGGIEVEKPVLDQADQEEQMLKLLEDLTDEDEEEEINNVEKDYDKYMIDTMGPVGPMPLLLMENKRDNYTGLMPGEGDAIAHYVEEGKRIPRRGEVGLTSEQIQRFEDLGYVMSGSRHKRMNAVRQMKEAKVISQQEKKAIAIYNYQQKNKTEVKLDAYFKGMLEEKLEENKRKNPKG